MVVRRRNKEVCDKVAAASKGLVFRSVTHNRLFLLWGRAIGELTGCWRPLSDIRCLRFVAAKPPPPRLARSSESRPQPRQEIPPRACECGARSPTRPPAPQAWFGTWTGARLERTGRLPGQSAARRSFGGQRGRWDGYSVVRATGWATVKTSLWCGVPWIRLGNRKSSDRSSAYLIHAWVTGVRCQSSLIQTALLNYVTTLRGFPTL